MRARQWGQKPVWIEADPKKEKFRVRVPNVRSWAVGVTIRINPKETPPDVHVRPVVGGFLFVELTRAYRAAKCP